ncbi:MAG: sensor hybrid histidine kinase [Myxococcales bacterium]|nr:sensor hybrid histidine kinase [Myxococcales bacterium]
MNNADAGSFLIEAARLFASSLELATTIEHVAQLAVPRVADWCLVDLLVEDGTGLERLAVGHHLPGGEETARLLKRRYHFRQARGGGVEVVETGAPILLRDIDDEMLQRLATDEPHLTALRRIGLKSAIGAPMIARGRTIGVLTHGSCTRNYDADDVRLVEQLALTAAAAIDNARLFEAEHRARVRVTRLQEIVAAISRASTASEVANTACRIAGEVMEASSGALWIAQPDGSLIVTGEWGPTRLLDQFRVLMPGTPGVPALEVMRTGTPIWIETVEAYRRLAPEVFERAAAAGRVFSYGAVPLQLETRIDGVIVFAHPMPHRYDADERGFYQAVANHAAQALDRARLLDAERRLLERERAARAEAEVASRVKDEFLATVSHELRTPLHAIIGWTSLLARKTDDASAVARGIGVISRNAQAQARIIDDILDVSRIITGNLRLESKALELKTIVSDAIDVVRPTADAKQQRLIVELPPEPCIFVGDGPRLQQAVLNLLSNAVKFTATGGEIKVSLTRVRSTISITVTDRGAGIDAKFLPHVFERFRQADSSTTRKVGGLGLGLSIVRHIVELHGGTVSASSDGLTLGATFCITLPVLAVRPAEDALPPAPAHADISGRRILVVDDELDSRELLQEVLASVGAIVATAASVREAFTLIGQFGPHLLISDIGMPDEDGYQLIKRIRNLATGADLPAIALTAYARAEDRSVAIAAGFNTHLAKPVDTRELVSAISIHVRR